MKIVSKLLIAGAVTFVLLQLIRPSIPAKPATAELQAPPQVRQILQNSCYSCHSDQRRLSWFDQIEPGYWLVRDDVLTARQHLDFSTLGSRPAAAQKAALYEAVNMIQLGAMPLPRFLALHPEAKVTPKELTVLKTYLAPWTPEPEYSANAAAGAPASAPEPVNLAAVQPEFNGFPFDSTFESWKPISTTDRGDNNTFRFVLGNDIAVKAARSGNISPWPDGSRFAKIAWQQSPGPDGLLHPGNFVQVELMEKGAQRYKTTDGWGWGRWRGLNLQPYGKDARFVNECTSCHMPLRGDDYVYTLPITAAPIPREEVVNNSAAALPASLPYQPFDWSAITMYVDPKTHTTAMLYGNEVAMQAVNARAAAAQAPSYAAGSLLALVTWVQRDDPHWFGARIPGAPQSVEFVQVEPTAETDGYRRFTGTSLIEDHPAANLAAQRSEFILNLAPVRLP